MRVGIQTWGSEGDIRPLIALGAGLVASGHEARIAVTSVDDRDYGPECKALGIGYSPVPERLGRDLEGLISRIDRPDRMWRVLSVVFEEFFYPYVDEMLRAARELAASCDVLVSQFLCYPVRAAALQSGRPHATVMYWPYLVPTQEVAPDGFPNLSRFTNRMFWRLLAAGYDIALRKRVKALWVRERLPPFGHVITGAWPSPQLNLLAASPAIWPHREDWEPQHKLCGFLEMPETQERRELPQDVREFLDAGEPPLYMGFGSMQQLDAERSVRLLRDAARLAGRRAIVATTLRDRRAGAPEKDILYVERADHRALFPRCAAVVHHGGAGTTQTALLAGRPTVTVGFTDEQVSWGRRVHELGAGGAPQRYLGATPEGLARAIARLLESPEPTRAAQRLGEKLAAEDGVGTAIRELETLARKH